MKQLLSISAIYSDRRMVAIFLLGFISGLPFLLTLSTLHAWLIDVGVSKTTIGLLAIATAPYALKFLWAPLTDHLPIPYFSARLGLRRSWLLLSQFALACALIILGMTNPATNIFHTASATFFVCLCAAFQDNAIEAYRIETLHSKEIGPGASSSILGFRLGMWVSGGGALYLSTLFSWVTVYCLMAAIVIVGMVTTLLIPRPRQEPALPKNNKSVRLAMWPAITSFFKEQDWPIILMFIVCYKVGDTVLNMMSMPFLREIGFSNAEIAAITKTFGIFAMVVGGVIGGLMLMQLSIQSNLVICVSLLMTSCLMFMIQASLGHNITFLVFTVGIENLACGMSAAALIAYLSRLCHIPHTATHYALFSSFTSLARLVLSSAAGWMADQMSWTNFYAIIAIACLPALIIIFRHPQHFFQPSAKMVYDS